MERERLLAVFRLLFQAHGPQHWWPGQTPFEVMVGAILTQNTSWTNVERAIAGLIARIPLSADAILSLPVEVLADLIRPAGYFNVKARRLRSFCLAMAQDGGPTAMATLPTDELRRRLLAIHGVGPETADDILLYAFERPVFVVDAYTRRIFARLGEVRGDEGYETIRHAFERACGPDVELMNEYHALIVKHGKDICRTRPRCADCPLHHLCPYPT